MDDIVEQEEITEMQGEVHALVGTHVCAYTPSHLIIPCATHAPPMCSSCAPHVLLLMSPSLLTVRRRRTMWCLAWS